MATGETVSVGMRLTHTMHGDGVVTRIEERVNRKTNALEPCATVSFTSANGKISWSALLNGDQSLPGATDTSLVMIVAVKDIQENHNWFAPQDYGDLSEILIDLERLTTKHSAVTPLSDSSLVSSQLSSLSKNLEKVDVSPDGDTLNALKTVVDWSVSRLFKTAESNSRSASAKLVDVNQWIANIEDAELWTRKIYPALPEAIKPGTDRVLVSVAWMVSAERNVSMFEAARILTGSLEKRIYNIHMRGAELAKSRLEAQLSKSV